MITIQANAIVEQGPTFFWFRAGHGHLLCLRVVGKNIIDFEGKMAN
jgi:hypothetical protein